MVDAVVSSVEDYLVDGLSFKLNPGASYVTDRRSVSYVFYSWKQYMHIYIRS